MNFSTSFKKNWVAGASFSGLTGVGLYPSICTGPLPATPSVAMTGTKLLDASLGAYLLSWTPDLANGVTNMQPNPLYIGANAGVPGYMRLEPFTRPLEHVDLGIGAYGNSTMAFQSTGKSVSFATADAFDVWAMQVTWGAIGTVSKIRPSLGWLNNILNTDVPSLMVYVTLWTGSSPGVEVAPTGTQIFQKMVTWGASTTASTTPTTSASVMTPAAVGTVGYARMSKDTSGLTCAVDLSVSTIAAGTGEFQATNLSFTQADVDLGSAFATEFKPMTMTWDNAVGSTFPMADVVPGSGFADIYSTNSPTLELGVGQQEDSKTASTVLPTQDVTKTKVANFAYTRMRPLETGSVVPRGRSTGLSGLILKEDRLNNYLQVLSQFDGTASVNVRTISGWTPVVPRVWDGSKWERRLPVTAKKR